MAGRTHLFRRRREPAQTTFQQNGLSPLQTAPGHLALILGMHRGTRGPPKPYLFWGVVAYFCPASTARRPVPSTRGAEGGSLWFDRISGQDMACIRIRVDAIGYFCNQVGHTAGWASARSLSSGCRRETLGIEACLANLGREPLVRPDVSIAYVAIPATGVSTWPPAKGISERFPQP